MSKTAVAYGASRTAARCRASGDLGDLGDLGDHERAGADATHFVEGPPPPVLDEDVEAALDLIARGVDLLTKADVVTCDDRALLEQTVVLDRQLNRVAAQRARRLAAIDDRQSFTRDGHVTTASWWRSRTRRDVGEASRDVTTAVRLKKFDLLRSALARGEVRLAHAERFARAARPHREDWFAAHEETLVDLARHARPSELGRACDHVADLADTDGVGKSDELSSGPDPRRSLSFVRTVDGLGDLQATLDPLTADRLEALMHAYAEPDPRDTPDDERRTPTQRRHDAFDRLLQAAEEHPDVSKVHGAKPHVLVTVDLFTLLGRDDLATRSTRLRSGSQVHLDRVLKMLEDAKLTTILMLGPYRPVAVGRTHRVLPGYLRALLDIIHRHCRGPGCDRPIPWSQAAHLKPWKDGGETDFNETLPGCEGHHALMDVLGWKVSYDPDTGICTWTSPDGRTVLCVHPPKP